MRVLQKALTFDDVLLVPAHSSILPREVSLSTQLTRTIALNLPLLSAAMDTVTESRLAIALAQEGGIGIIHRNMSPARQAAEVEKVKKSESGMIVDPVTVGPGSAIGEVKKLMEDYRISGIPVTDKKNKLVGIITNRDMRFETDMKRLVRNVMTKENLVTAAEKTSLEQAKKILHKHKIEKLPIVDKHSLLRGLI